MTPTEAVRRAKLLEHPFDSSFQMPDHVLDAMYQVITKGTEAIHEERSRRLKWMKQKARELESREQELHARMEPKVAEVLAPKKLLLLAEMIKIVGYGDKTLVDDICKGMNITGEGKDTGCFAPECKPPMLEREDLWRSSKSAQDEVASRVPKHMSSRSRGRRGSSGRRPGSLGCDPQ